MAKKFILITGGAGYIGSHAVVELAQAGYAPVILDNLINSQRSILKNLNRIVGYPVPFYCGDCSDPAVVARVLKRYGPFEGVIHFAALKAVGESIEQPLRYYRNNIDGLLTMLEAAAAHGIAHFVFSSSCTVYGEPDSLPVKESTPFKDAESPYGDTKKVAEGILRAVVDSGSPLKVVALRYFNPIGAHPSALIGELPLGVPKNLVPFVTQASAGIRKEIVVFGDDYPTPDGTCIRDYIHVVDLARAHVAALSFLIKKKDKNCYETFNIGTGRGESVLSVIKTFQKATGVNVPYRIGPRRSGDICKIYASVRKANKVLGWRAEISFKDALQHSWAWQKGLNAK